MAQVNILITKLPKDIILNDFKIFYNQNYKLPFGEFLHLPDGDLLIGALYKFLYVNYHAYIAYNEKGFVIHFELHNIQKEFNVENDITVNNKIAIIEAFKIVKSIKFT